MRPLELRLSGFRSYRSEQTVSFRELDLLAIIGDTGAGKSSLLEAMTWALYGASTWSKKSSTELLAHGARRMTVSLEFEGAGERWNITRTFARSGGGGAELSCLSNPAIAKVDGVRQVDPEIERILGLSYDVFCSCVLLPQGKFERLLKATKGEKTDTLKSILRLEELEDIREIAGAYERRLADRERELLERRTLFRADPAGEAADAERALAELRPALERLSALASRVDELTREAEETAKECRDARDGATALRARHHDRSTDLRALAQNAATLEAELAEAEAEVRRTRDALTVVTDALAARSDAGEDRATLSTLHQVRAALGRLAGARSSLADETTALGAARAARAEAAGEHETLVAAGERAASVAAEAQIVADAAVQEVETAQQVADAVHAAMGARAQTQEALGSAAQEAASAEHELEAAVAELERARRVRSEATEAREETLRHQAAAHAASGCVAGDACPICERELPHGFAPPAAPDLAAVDARLGEAVGAEDRCAKVERRLAVASETAAGRHTDAAQRAGAADDALTLALASAGELPGVAEADDPEAAIAVALGALREASGLRADEARDAVAAREAAVRAAGEAASTVAKADAEVGARERALEACNGAVDTARADLSALAEELPAFCAMPAGEVSEDDIRRAEGLVEGRLAGTVELERQRDEARERAGSAADAEHGLTLRLQKEVRTPVASIRASVWTLALELPASLRQDLREPETDVAPDVLAALAELVNDRIRTRIEGLDAAAEAASARAAECAEETRAALAEAGFSARSDLERRTVEVRAEVLTAEHKRDAASREIAPVERLDALLSRARELRGGFEALRDALADRAFVGYVVARRQRALLAYASKVLQDITERYAFTEDFQILDRESGLPRSPDTLSGGETFIASLALALGLVEVADRSGGDLRALFLDEGFGTLDATILDAALTALEERARAGRLIGVISHVPTIAERVETVLEVRSGVGGSTAHVLTGAEREDRLNESAATAAAM